MKQRKFQRKNSEVLDLRRENGYLRNSLSRREERLTSALKAMRSARNKERLLGNALHKTLIKAGVLHKDSSVYGSELLVAAESFCEHCPD